MTGNALTAVVLALTVAIYVLDVLPRYLAPAVTPSDPETDDDAGDAPAGFMTDDDVQELAAIGGCMIDGRNDAARVRFENWMDEIEPAWRSMR